MRETRQSGSEGGEAGTTGLPYPYNGKECCAPKRIDVGPPVANRVSTSPLASHTLRFRGNPQSPHIHKESKR
jgi:hypothetical protein